LGAASLRLLCRGRRIGLLLLFGTFSDPCCPTLATIIVGGPRGLTAGEQFVVSDLAGRGIVEFGEKRRPRILSDTGKTIALRYESEPVKQQSGLGVRIDRHRASPSQSSPRSSCSQTGSTKRRRDECRINVELLIRFASIAAAALRFLHLDR
jgi:hypothetical protein